jgi:signal transduction histidine kinase
MIERLTSLRVWLLAAMVATAVVTIVAGNFVIDRLNAASELAADRAKGLVTARAIASQIQDGAGLPELRALQQVLPNDQIVVVRHGVTIFAGPPMASQPLELTVSAPLPGGRVILRDHHSPSADGLAQGTLVAGVIAVLIIGEAWLAATVLVRTVRRPIGRAIGTADQLAAGDFSARMGVSGPEEFAHLGRAFDAMAGQLQQADTEQKRFLADLAHEVATPLSAVSGFALALADGSARTASEHAEAADIVVDESDRLHRLLDDVRHLNRLELADSTRREQVDLDALCAETARRFRLTAENGKVTLLAHAGQVSTTRTRARAAETHSCALSRNSAAAPSHRVSLAPRNGQVKTRPTAHTLELRHSITNKISRRIGTTGPMDGTTQHRIADTAQRSDTRMGRSSPPAPSAPRSATA